MMRVPPLCFLLSIMYVAPLAAATSCPNPQTLSFQIERELYRDKPGFTEGLEVHDGEIYESTGDYVGDTEINRIDPVTGKVSVLMNAGKRYFGEGLTFFNGRFYQMTWREHRVFVFDPELRPITELSNPREGWGLTHDSTHLIASDGSSRLFFLSPKDFKTVGQLSVTSNGWFVENLNELEYVQGAIWANVFESWNVMKISPATGCVEAIADIRSLRQHMRPADLRYIDSNSDFVPNGIAYDPASGLFLVTGKFWPVIFFGRFEKSSGPPP